MDFVSNQEPQIRAMLQSIGIASVEELFSSIPQPLRLDAPTVDDGISECEGMRCMEALAGKNTYSRFDNYLGAGAYEHHVPALVGAIAGKSEFLTSYTPYQSEASQGMLQVIFEFQTALCALTGLDAANASLYDGASACAEALLMALRIHPERRKVLIAGSLHPHYRAVVEQYLESHAVQIETIPFHSDGRLDFLPIEETLDQQTAAILVQSPNFFGIVEDVKGISAQAKEKGALMVLCANPLVFGLFPSAVELGADIAVGDGQPFGVPLQYGGPYVGYMACRQEFVRQMPGRICGETVDTEGRRGFVLTLQAREQQIRREKATSNVCTNQALAALSCLVAILWYGKEGVQKLALTNYQRAHYLWSRLKDIPGIRCQATAPFFNEFVVEFQKPLVGIVAHFRSRDIEPGVQLNSFYPSMQALLVAVTETKTLAQLDRYASVAKEAAAL